RLERGRAGWQVAMARRKGAEARIERILRWQNGRGRQITKRAFVVASIIAVPTVAVVAAVRPITSAVVFPPLPQEIAVAAPPPPAESGVSPVVGTHKAASELSVLEQAAASPAAESVGQSRGKLLLILVDDANIEFIETPRLRDLLHGVVRDTV